MKLPPYARFHLNIFPTTLLGIPTEHLLEIFPDPIPADQFCLEISEQQIAEVIAQAIGDFCAL